MKEGIQLDLTKSQIDLLCDAISYAITFQSLSEEEDNQLITIRDQIQEQADDPGKCW